MTADACSKSAEVRTFQCFVLRRRSRLPVFDLRAVRHGRRPGNNGEAEISVVIALLFWPLSSPALIFAQTLVVTLLTAMMI